MRKSLVLLASAALMGLTLAAHADTFTLTNVTFGTSSSPTAPTVGTITGSVKVDASTGVITSFNASVNITADGKSYSFASDSLYQNPVNNGIDTSLYVYNGNPGGADALVLSYLNLGTVLCTEMNPCAGASGQVASGLELSNGTSVFGQYGIVYSRAQDDGTYNITSGTLVDTTVHVAPTPEPSSLILLGTGILGFAGAARRRFCSGEAKGPQ